MTEEQLEKIKRSLRETLFELNRMANSVAVLRKRIEVAEKEISSILEELDDDGTKTRPYRS